MLKREALLLGRLNDWHTVKNKNTLKYIFSYKNFVKYLPFKTKTACPREKSKLSGGTTKIITCSNYGYFNNHMR